MDKKLSVFSPFDGKPVGEVPLSNEKQAMEMLARAHECFSDRDKWLEPYERIDILNKVGEAVRNEAEDFAKLIALEGGKPLQDARVEVARAIDGIQLAIRALMSDTRGVEIPMGLTKATVGRTAYTTYEPSGVVIAVSAFNHPLNLAIHQIIPAIAVGCPVIFKPASATPLCGQRLIELIHKAGLPKDWCQFIACPSNVAEKLVTDERVAFFSFIGSGKVGWALRSKLAPGVRCTLEHGGVAPVIVDKNVDLDKVVPALLKGAFYHAGQVCVSVQRIFAEQSIAKTLADKLADGAAKLIVGDPTSDKTQVGPLIDPKEVDRVDEWIQQAVKDGAELLTGGKKITETTYTPTVLFNPSQKSKVSREELFGPGVCVYSYTDRLEAIKLANSLPYAFQSAVFSDDVNVCLDTVKRLKAIAVMVNDHTAFRCDWMPFGGYQQSGYGLGGIGYTMQEMCHPKLTVFNCA